MYHIIYHKSDAEVLAKEVVPLFTHEKVHLVDVELIAGRQWEKGDIVIAYLDQIRVRELVKHSLDQDLSMAFLPHPGATKVSKGLGTGQKMEDVIAEIEIQSEPQKIDVMLCNGVPVFQAVSVGEVFALEGGGVTYNFFRQVWRFLQNIKKLGSFAHKGVTLHTGDEKLMKTSALGIVAVSHAKGSVVARRLVSDGTINDGFLYTVILAPQNVLTVIGFLLQSLLPAKKRLLQLPNFIGYLKTEDLKICFETPTTFTIDGEKFESNTIELSVRKKAINLVHRSQFLKSEKKESARSVKTENLPKGEKRDELIKYSLPWLPRATAEEFKELFSTLRKNARLTNAYLVMMILSTIIATFGLFGNSSPVIIGAMILAPLMSPIVSFSMGVVRYDTNMLKYGIKTILIGTLVSLLFAALVTLIIPLRLITGEIGARLSPNLLDLGIAVASGVAAAYAHAKEEIAKTLAGVAIAVALVPPLAVAGIGLGWFDWEVFSGAFLLYLTNLAGIIMFGGLTFLVLGFAPFRRARAGLIYTLIIIVLVCIPLTFSFNRIRQEAQITEMLESSEFGDIRLTDVKVRFGENPSVSLRLISSSTIEAEQIKQLKSEIERQVGKEIRLEVITAMEFE